MEHPLRTIRESLNLSIDSLAGATGVSARTILRAEQGHILYPGSRRLLCQFFNKSADELGLLPQQQRVQRTDEVWHLPIIVVLTEEQAAALLGDTESMKNRFDESRRALVWQMLVAGATLTTAPHSVLDTDLLERLVKVFTNPARVDEPTIVYLEQLIAGYWQKSNESQTEVVEQALPFYLPKLTALAHQTSPFQRRAAHLASQGYILAAEVDRANVGAMKAYAGQGVLYAQIADDPNIQAAALKQQATMYLVDKAPDLALHKYLEALPLIGKASPLLRSRIYLGLASAYARCGSLHKQDAQRYLGLARDGFPEQPESDPNYLYTVCGRSVLHLYEALTYTDLRQHDDAWQSLTQVDGIQPKLPTPENTRIEIINLQARTAATQGNMEQSIAYWLVGIDAASKHGYSIWQEEATDVYSYLCECWPGEQQVKALASHLEVA